jgi:NAD-dependent deacetylase
MTKIADEQIISATQLIKNSHHMIVFTGAGVSTPSGIPDFRSADTGLWEKDDPMQVASATAFKYHPDRFYRWLKPLLQASSEAQPNPAHKAISELEHAGIVKAVITQNIDNLHQKAGSRNVIELHGSMEHFHCPVCHQPGSNPQSIIKEILTDSISHCVHCGSIMKPDITLFEEPLPVQAWQQADSEVRKADLMLVAGSSLEVVPASSLPYDAFCNGCRIIIVNYSNTYLDSRAEVVLHIDVAQGLPLIVQQVFEG